MPKADVFNGKIFNSTKTLSVYDCSEFRYGTKSVLLYSGKSGTGTVVHSDSRDLSAVDFEDAAPKTVGETMLKKVCGK
jgi:hypothetical protein